MRDALQQEKLQQEKTEVDAQKPDAQHIHKPEAQRIINDNLVLFMIPTTPPPARETFRIKLSVTGIDTII